MRTITFWLPLMISIFYKLFTKKKLIRLWSFFNATSTPWQNLLLGIKRFNSSHWKRRATIFSNGNRASRFSELTNFSSQDVKPQLMGFMSFSRHCFISRFPLTNFQASALCLNANCLGKSFRISDYSINFVGITPGVVWTMEYLLETQLIRRVLDKSHRIKFAYYQRS